MMKNTSIIAWGILLLSMQAGAAGSAYQFPSYQTPAYTAPVAPPMNQGGGQGQQLYYYYPQYTTQYPVAQGYVPAPYGYATPYAAYPGMYPQQQMQAQQVQAPAQQPFKYASPYNPQRAAAPGPKPPPPPEPKKVVKPWGDTRYIWPDFYTDATGDFWDKMINAPYDMGYMPGGWRFPLLKLT